MKGSPEVSVVTATHNRAERLGLLIDALRRQSLPASRFEVIIVDDGSSDGTAALLEREQARNGLALRSIAIETAGGPAAARNRGWQAASAPLIAFTDDDCVPAPGWLRALVAAHRRAPGAVLQGRTEPHPDERHRLGAFSRSQLVTELGVNFQACNVAYPRDLLERLGGFDESFVHYGEDADLAWRALAGGAEAIFVPEALVHHAVHDAGALAVLRDAPRWADAVRCFARHSQMRSAFRHRIFWRASHEGLLLAAAGIALRRRTRGASLALCLPYLRQVRTQHGGWPGSLAALPAHAAIDAAEVAALLHGSARFGTLVL
jgi:glycosyltransferase involved in cell wall biosynthesis